MQHRAQFVRFLLVGTFNTMLDFALYFVFANLLLVYPVMASILSTSLTMCISFFLNHHFVFGSNKKRRHTIVQFVAVTLFNVWLVQSAVIFAALLIFRNLYFFSHHHWTLNILAKLCGVATSFVLNFMMYRFVFREKQSESDMAAVL